MSQPPITPQAEPVDLYTLAAAIIRLDGLAPADAARQARRLVEHSRAILSAAGDRYVVAALAQDTAPGSAYRRLAEHLGVTDNAVNKAVTRHRAATGDPADH